MAKKGTRKAKPVKGPHNGKFVLVRMDDESLHVHVDDDGNSGDERFIGYNTLEYAKREAATLAEEAGCEVLVYQYVGMFIPPEQIPPEWSEE